MYGINTGIGELADVVLDGRSERLRPRIRFERSNERHRGRNRVITSYSIHYTKLYDLDCVNRYTRGMDRLDRESALSAFHEDATLEYGVFAGTPAEFFDYFRELHLHHHKSTNHMICNHVCELDGDTAHTERNNFV